MGRIAGWILSPGVQASKAPLLSYLRHMQTQMDPDGFLAWSQTNQSLSVNSFGYVMSAGKIQSLPEQAAFPTALASLAGRYFLLFDGSLFHPDIPPGGDALWLLQQYVNHGNKVLEHLNGRFAFVLLDKHSGKVILGRDAFGVKPLHWTWRDGVLLVASEAKALWADTASTRKLDLGIAYDFLVNQQAEHRSETFYADIQQVPPGNLLQWNFREGSKAPIHTSFLQLGWNQASPSVDAIQSKNYASQIEEQLWQAIKTRVLYSKKKAGGLLSGGVDSSLLSAGLARIQASTAQTFTAAFTESHIGEQNWASQVAEHLGVSNHLVFPKADQLLEDFQDFIFHQEGPTLSLGTYLQYQLFRQARQQGVLWLFDGQGADGLFGGHQFHKPMLWSQLRRYKQRTALSA